MKSPDFLRIGSQIFLVTWMIISILLCNLQALQATKDDFISILHHGESLNLKIEKLEAPSQAQEFELSSLQTAAIRLLSACSHATQELQVKMSDLSCFDSEPEDVNVVLEIKSPASFRGKIEKEDVSQFAQAADNLLLRLTEK